MLGFFFSLIFSTPVWAQEAFFTSLNGDVKVVDSSGTEKAASIEMQLNKGDKVVTGSGGQAMLMYFTGKEVALYGDQNHTIGQKDGKSGGLGSAVGTLLSSQDEAGTTPGATRLGEGTTTSGSGTGKIDAVVIPLYPVETKVLDARPVFKWKDTRGGNQKYIISVSNVFMGSEIAFPAMNTSEAQFPAAEEPLQVDVDYSWSVKAQNGKLLSSPVAFSLFDPKDKPRLDAALANAKSNAGGDTGSVKYFLLTANVYKKFDLLQQEQETLEKLVQAHPNLAQGHMRLATVYEKTGQIDQAASARAKANALRK